MRRGVLLLTVGIVLAAASGTQAATYEVTKRGDHAPNGCSRADCTLREAMLAANTTVVGDRVLLPSRKPYRLGIAGGLEDGSATGDLDVNAPVVISHPGKGRATVEASRLDRVFDAYASLALRKLVLTEGLAPVYGGAIRTEARLSVVDSVIRGNKSGTCGGGIHTHHRPALRIIRSTVRGNESQQGGGVSASCFGTGGPLTMIRSTIAGNRGGIEPIGGPGGFDDYGGGMYFQTAPRFESTIANSTFAGNSAGPGSDADGGGLYADLGGLRVTGSTFSRNRAGDAGGGIEVHDTESLRLVNTTISNNRAGGNGGGIDFAGGVASLNAVTVARNIADADGSSGGIGGGLLYDVGLRIENSLFALNRIGGTGGGSSRNDCAGEGAVDSAGHNLVSNLSLCELDGPGDLARRNPKLGKLRRNGGPTKTIALKKGSSAIGKARRSTAPSRDQRRRKRDRQPDIGAFER
jgi:hypothetical protein